VPLKIETTDEVTKKYLMSPYNYSEDYISKYGTYNVDEIGTTESVEITCLTNLEDRKFEGGVGKIFRVKCPSCKGIKTSVFGSFIYHPLSSICSSAVHAGNLEEEGGYILVEKVQGKEIYNGSVGSYDKISSTFSKSKISFKTKKAIPPTKISCTDTPAVSPFNTATVGTKFVVICPKKCSENKLFIYGTEVYSDQSPICLAGFHSGVMNDRGGELEFIIESGQNFYKGSKSFGIISKSRDAYVRSYKFIGQKSAISYKFKEDYKGSINKKYAIKQSKKNTKDTNIWEYVDLTYLDKNSNLNEKTKTIHHKGNSAKLNNGEYATFINLKDVEWNNGIIQSNFYFKECTLFAFLFRFQDKRNYYSIEFEPFKLTDNIRLVSKVNGSSKIIISNTTKLSLSTWYRTNIIMTNDKIEVFLQTDNIRENKPIFKANIEEISRGTIGYASSGNDDTYINGIVIDEYTPHISSKNENKNKRSWDNYLKHVEPKTVKKFCKNLFRENESENLSCRLPANFCKMKCDDYIPSIENILNFNCYKNCSQKIVKKDNEIKVKKISWKPKIGDRVDFSTDKGKYAAGTIISSQNSKKNKKIQIYSVTYITPEGEQITSSAEYPSDRIKKCGEELPKRRDC
jgi:hypothetical protein